MQLADEGGGQLVVNARRAPLTDGGAWRHVIPIGDEDGYELPEVWQAQRCGRGEEATSFINVEVEGGEAGGR